MYQQIPTKVLTNEVRLSYCALNQPRAQQNGQGEPKYSVTLLIPKSDTATVNNILQSIEHAAKEAQGKLWNGVRPPQMNQPLYDGDGVRANGTAFGPECKGHWVITASSKQKPGIRHINDVNTELAPQDVYSGMYARVTINFFGYNSNGRRGVGCGLGNVLKTNDGEPLGGGASAEADFAGIASAPITPPWGGMAAVGAQPAINPITGQPI